MLPSNKSIARNVGVFGGAQAFSVLAALIRTKVAAVMIGTTGVGLSAIYNTVVNFFSTLAGMGLSFSGVKYLSEVYASGDKDALEKEIGQLRLLGLICSAIGLVLSLVFSPILSMMYFGDMSEMMSFMALSVFVVATIISGIEMAILKACQKVRYLAISSIWTAIISVAVSVPFYILMGVKGVLWAVVVSGVVGVLATMWYGGKVATWRMCYVLRAMCYVRGKDKNNQAQNQNTEHSTQHIAHHTPHSTQHIAQLLTLGAAFLGGGLIATGAEMAILGYFSAVATMAILGLYKAGYQLSITYTGMIFTAVSNDFYPRLSAVNQNLEERNTLISRQIRVLLYITTPLVVVFVLLVPYILPILFDDTFNPVCRMVQIAAISIIVKSVTMPLNFLPLSLGKSLDYLILEGAFWIIMVPLVIFGYKYWGLTGTGAAILLCHVIELVYAYLFCRTKYHFRLEVKG